jgi:hypothetical protein
LLVTVFQQWKGENEKLLVVVFQQQKGERGNMCWTELFREWEEMKGVEQWCFSIRKKVTSAAQRCFGIVKINSAAQQCFSIVKARLSDIGSSSAGGCASIGNLQKQL